VLCSLQIDNKTS